MRPATGSAAPVLAAAALLLVVAPSARAQSTGGAEFVPEPVLAAPAFAVAPPAVAPGAVLTVRYRLEGRARRARVRVDLVPEAGGPVAARLRLGRQATGRDLRARWRPKLAPGRYSARLRAWVVRRGGRGARASGASAIEVVAPTVSASTGVFPVQGPYTFGGPDARFGAGRPGHVHRGQDLLAAEGTPVVAPRGGAVTWRAYQGGGAGHYLVLRGDDGRDYVFMHLQDGSLAVQKGQVVSAGQRLAAVGSTGRSSGPHLHFEIWPSGWYAEGSEPIDPLPDLRAWAGV